MRGGRSLSPGALWHRELPELTPGVSSPFTPGVSSWEGVASTSRIVLEAGTVVRVISQHVINERNSEWLDKIVRLDRHSLVFCALHALMRLMEALGRICLGAQSSRGGCRSSRRHSRVETHLGLGNNFVRP